MLENDPGLLVVAATRMGLPNKFLETKIQKMARNSRGPFPPKNYSAEKHRFLSCHFMTQCKIGPSSQWQTNRKSHMHFRLVPVPSTLDDLLTLNGQNALWCRKGASFGAYCTNLNEDRPTLSATKI